MLMYVFENLDLEFVTRTDIEIQLHIACQQPKKATAALCFLQRDFSDFCSYR